jgi:multidrug efflux system outer membrane protein
MMLALISFLSIAQAGPVFFNDLENFKNQNLSIQTQKQNLETSEDVLLSKKLFWTPSLSVSANKKKTEAKSNGLTATETVDYVEADVNWNLFRGGADWNSLQAAKAQNKYAELGLLNQSLAVEVKASDLIFKSLYLAESHRIQEGLLKLKEETLRIVKDRYAQGKLPAQEMTKAEVDLAQQRNRARLAGLDVSENRSLILSAFVTDLETKEWPFSESVGVKIDTKNQLPLIEQKYWLAQSKDELWQASRGAYWPSLDLSLAYQESPIKERDTKQWVGLATLTLPLWSRFETKAAVSSALADKVAAQNDFKDTEQNLKQRFAFLKEKINIARQNLTESKKNLEKAKGLYLDILKTFRLGRISTNDLFIEQNRLLDSETDLALSQLSFHQTLIESCALAGIKSSECLQ